MAAGSFHTFADGGTGDRFAKAVVIVAGVAALVASLITFLYALMYR